MDIRDRRQAPGSKFPHGCIFCENGDSAESGEKTVSEVSSPRDAEVFWEEKTECEKTAQKIKKEITAQKNIILTTENRRIPRQWGKTAEFRSLMVSDLRSMKNWAN